MTPLATTTTPLTVPSVLAEGMTRSSSEHSSRRTVRLARATDGCGRRSARST